MKFTKKIIFHHSIKPCSRSFLSVVTIALKQFKFTITIKKTCIAHAVKEFLECQNIVCVLISSKKSMFLR